MIERKVEYTAIVKIQTILYERNLKLESLWKNILSVVGDCCHLPDLSSLLPRFRWWRNRRLERNHRPPGSFGRHWGPGFLAIPRLQVSYGRLWLRHFWLQGHRSDIWNDGRLRRTGNCSEKERTQDHHGLCAKSLQQSAWLVSQKWWVGVVVGWYRNYLKDSFSRSQRGTLHWLLYMEGCQGLEFK